MDENKNEILEEGTESLTEEMEEVAEETVEEAEEAVEEITEEAEDEVEDSTEAEKYVDVKLLIAENAKLKRTNKVLKGILTGIVAIVLVVAIAFGGVNLYKTVYNPYNHMGYYNISGMTIEDVAELNDMTVEEVIEMFSLPEDISPNTYYDVMEFLIPVSYMAEMYGIDVETMKEAFGFGDEITGDSTWGEALDSMTLLTYLGSEELVDEFKADYGFGDEVTSETLWGKVRAKANKIDYERHLAEQATAVEEDITEAE